MTGDDDDVFMTRSLNVTPKTSERHLIVRSDKVTDNTLCSEKNSHLCFLTQLLEKVTNLNETFRQNS